MWRTVLGAPYVEDTDLEGHMQFDTHTHIHTHHTSVGLRTLASYFAVSQLRRSRFHCWFMGP